MLTSSEQNRQTNPWVTTLLLLLTLFTLFIVPVFPDLWLNRLYALFYSAIFLCASYALGGSRGLLLKISLLMVAATSISSFLGEGSFKSVIRILQFIYFILLVSALIRKISVSPTVSGLVIMEAVTAYLLLGFAFGIMVLMAETMIGEAYSESFILSIGASEKPDIREALYYTFVTYTTTGYGDITPRHPVTRSLAMLISICGQLYVAIIIALLVGKFAARNIEPTTKS
jgi:hypothetical protein